MVKAHLVDSLSTSLVLSWSFFFWWLHMFVTCFSPHSVVFNWSPLAIKMTACIVLTFFLLLSHFIIREIIPCLLPKTICMHHDMTETWGEEICFICSVVQKVARAFNDQGRAFDIYIYIHPKKTRLIFSSIIKDRMVRGKTRNLARSIGS